ncbi:TraR/DksA family transcriptional regulator [Streptomyces sp. KMM 9044]|uniref:TraR/DksA family transcriptional regulator n=1 Tax=Streptomyces sp. KMM 9044 TaxID=2744474 RepID=UPI00215188DA|nr:TraR/DksA C4-type zinc finger protein [Streptomyces sp. KMM 9044]WAX76688.1 TraR/DksA C4-type zinc finger protein [Streptomyces sp. KMM 9044]
MTHQTIDEHDEVRTSEDLGALRASLREQQLFRRDQLRQFAVDAGVLPGGPGSPGVPQVAGQIEVQVRLAASARMVLADVEAALTRMDTGDYGVCHLCRGPVERDRLLIVPQARYCARCQQVREAVR